MTPACAEVLELSRTAFRRSQTEQVLSQASRAQREARYEQIQQWRREGYNISQIAQRLGCHWETARKYYDATSFPERKRRPMMLSSLDPYLAYLEQRHLDGCENASQLWREIQALGFPGTARPVLRWMQLRRTHPAPSTPGPYRDKQTPSLPQAQSALPSARQLAWLLVSDPAQLSHDGTLILEHIRQLPMVAHVYVLAQQFVVMIKQRQTEQLDLWLTACSTHEVTQVRTFALGIQQDYAAIRGALETPWSNGQTEGQVNRLKFLKRQMYGRARFDLLRLRVLHPP
jgi:transposase